MARFQMELTPTFPVRMVTELPKIQTPFTKSQHGIWRVQTEIHIKDSVRNAVWWPVQDFIHLDLFEQALRIDLATNNVNTGDF